MHGRELNFTRDLCQQCDEKKHSNIIITIRLRYGHLTRAHIIMHTRAFIYKRARVTRFIRIYRAYGVHLYIVDFRRDDATAT